MAETVNARPLGGLRVVVTRAAEQAGAFERRFTEAGAEVVLLPVQEYVPVDGDGLNAALLDLAGFDWLLFTSTNAVRFVSARMATLGVAAPGGRPATAAVGHATAAALREAGLRCDLVAQKSTGLDLAHELGQRMKGKKVLLPRSDRARPDLPEALAELGAQVTDLVAYGTRPLKPHGAEWKRVLQGDVHVVTFASPTAFYAFEEAAGRKALSAIQSKVKFVAIGPTTARAIREAGFDVAAAAAQPSPEALVGAVIHLFARRDST
jgi:uroporphyrinogen-III synthase